MHLVEYVSFFFASEKKFHSSKKENEFVVKSGGKNTLFYINII